MEVYLRKQFCTEGFTVAMHHIKQNQKETPMEQKNDKAIMVSANEKLCEFYQSRYELDVKTVQIPYLYSGRFKNDFLYINIVKTGNNVFINLKG